MTEFVDKSRGHWEVDLDIKIKNEDWIWISYLVYRKSLDAGIHESFLKFRIGGNIQLRD